MALGVLPLVFVFTGYALRPSVPVPAPVRLALVRAALVLGAYAVAAVELLGAMGDLGVTGITFIWLAGFVAALVAAMVRARRDGRRGKPALWKTVHGLWKNLWTRLWTGLSTGERRMAGALAVLGLSTLVLALLAEPNNYDSQTYHLPKIEHWVAQGDLDFFATAIHRQITISPGAEYLLLHLRLLTGGDALYNLVQWFAAVGCVLVASRITAQLGGDRAAQLTTALVLGTVPMVLLQATSTQTDLVVAAWVACLATLVLDAARTRVTFGTVLALGAATGLAALTKTSGLLGAAPLLVLWGVCALRRDPWRRCWRPVLGGAGVLLVAALFVGPFLGRMTAEFGNPLGPPVLRESIGMQVHDPASVLINGLRQAHTALDTPLGPLRHATARAVIELAGVLGVDPQGREITFGSTRFPVQAWYPDEDRAALPIQGLLLVIATVLALWRPGRLAEDPLVRGYAVAVTGSALLFAAMIQWQPWGTRLMLFAVVLGSPLAGLWLAGVAKGRRGSVAVAVVLAVAMLSATMSVGYGYPRRYVGGESVLALDSWDTRFVRRPAWAAEFAWAAAGVRERGAVLGREPVVGLVQQNDTWEYPWWLLLRDDAVIVPLQSVLPRHPAGDAAAMDVIVCAGSHTVCRRALPPGWTVRFQGYVGLAVPPA